MTKKIIIEIGLKNSNECNWKKLFEKGGEIIEKIK